MRSLFAPALLTLSVSTATAQVFTAPSAMTPHSHDTGFAAALGDPTNRQLVHQFTVSSPGADWVRLYFADVVLAGDVLAGNGAQLRLTAHRDGAEQLLDAVTLQQWRSSSAYFNGGDVEVEVLAFPGTGTSRVVMRGLEVGLPMPNFSICGPTDDRVLSSDPRSARLLPVGCTGWLIADCAGCFLTAGHCQGNIQVVQFNVPLSTSSGGLQQPPPSDQYAVDAASLQGNGGQGVGNDWAYFGTFPNSTTGMTATQRQGPGFTLAPPPPVGSGNEIRITGFGTDQSPATWNQVQQTHFGPLVTSTATTVQYQTDTTGGNSGSPVIWEQTDQAVGIHTHGGCQSSGAGQNSGTAFTHPGLQAGLATPLGVCAGGFSNAEAPTLLAPGTATQVSVGVGGAIIAGSATLHWRTAPGQLFQSAVMTMPTAGIYAANLPAFACGDQPQFYFSAQFTACGALTEPAAGPNGPFVASVGTLMVAFQDNFEQNLGWTTSTTATAGPWDRGVPVNDPAWAYDPTSDGDGSGSCYVTGNTLGNSDVDNGAVTLLSPALDRSTPGDLSYKFYLRLTDASGVDALTVDVSDNNGVTWRQVRRHTTNSSAWRDDVVSAQELAAAGVVPSATTRVRFIANDGNPQSIVEAGVDGFSLSALSCDPTAIGLAYCTTVFNSSGAAATLRGNGSLAVLANDVTLTAAQMPLNTFGLLVVSLNQAFVPGAGGSVGNLCVGLPTGRYNSAITSSGATGTIALVIDLNAVPQPTALVAVQPGETWNFQMWFRDVVVGAQVSNFSNGLALQFQ